MSDEAMYRECVEKIRAALNDEGITAQEMIDNIQTALDEMWCAKAAMKRRRKYESRLR